MADNSQDLTALQKGIDRLRKSNSWLKLGLTDSDFSNTGIQEYLLRPLESDIEKDKETENKLKAAVYLAVRHSRWKPRGSAKKLAEAAVEALRDARLMSLYESDLITAKQYQEELENNQISKIATTFVKAKKRYGRKLAKASLSTAIALTVGGPAGLISGGVMLVSELIPKKTKQKIKKNIKRTIKQTGETISRGVENLCDRAVAAAPEIARKFHETMEKVGEAVNRIARPIAEVAQSAGNQIKKVVKKLFNFLGK